MSEIFLNEVFTKLETLKIPWNYKRSNMSGVKYIGADKRKYGNPCRSVTIGLVRNWLSPGSGKIESTFTKLNPWLWDLLSELAKQVNVPHSFSSICINKNTIAEKHKDKNNNGVSSIIGLGNYVGGDLIIEDPITKKETVHDIRGRLHSFNGSTHDHWSTSFVGTRYSIIYFQ